MRPPEQQLLQRVLSSKQFEHAHILKRVLQYICERSAAGVAPKEFDIAVSAMGRQKSFDPRTDPIVRVSVGGVRERLAAYFAGEGAAEPLRLEIPKGQYRAIFTQVEQPPAAVRASGALGRFWRPYFTGAAPGNTMAGAVSYSCAATGSAAGAGAAGVVLTSALFSLPVPMSSGRNATANAPNNKAPTATAITRDLG